MWGEITVKDHGVTIVKFKAVAELIDGELESDETEEFVVVIDKKGPEITYKNETNEENGSSEEIENSLKTSLFNIFLPFISTTYFFKDVLVRCEIF